MDNHSKNNSDTGQKEFSPVENQPQLSEIQNFGWLESKDDRDKLINDKYFKKIIVNKIYDDKDIPKAVINHTVLNAIHILGRCNNPNSWEEGKTPTAWRIKNTNQFYQNKQGLVYGMVQSGKTASMLTLMGLAHSAGFNFLILLSSDKESLRNQTQERINETFNLAQTGEFVRYDSNGDYIGADTKIKSLTKLPMPDSDINGDYQKQTREIIINLKMGQTIIVCIKKNDLQLDKLLSDLKTIKNDDDILFQKIKCLIIDDEADYASQKTRKVGGIHEKIVDIRKLILKNSFVQYTATPQACLGADPKLLVGYPKHFLWLLDVYRDPNTNSNPSYLGHNEFFDEYEEDLVTLVDPRSWPHYQKINGKKVGVIDWDNNLRENAKLKDVEKEAIEIFLSNKTIRDSVCSYYKIAIVDHLITCAIRWYRFYKKQNHTELPSKDFIKQDYPHHAMIFNLVYSIKEQDSVLQLIELLFKDVKNEFYDSDITLKNNIFYKQYRKQSIKSLKLVKKEIPSLESLSHFIDKAINISGDNIVGTQSFIYQLNSSNNGSILQYEDKHADNYTKKSAIFIGGHILGRGLTVKNLSTSFFIRSQVKSLGDTNLQMCRWFGHKKKNIDIHSLYINSENLELFKSISNADNELREEFWQSMHTNQPAECFIINLQSSELFNLTSPPKRKFFKKDNGSLAGQNRYLEWPKKHSKFEENYKIIDDFLCNRESKEMHSRAEVYFDIEASEFIDFFKKLYIEDYLTNITPKKYIQYLNRYESSIPKFNIAVFGKNNELLNRENSNGHFINYRGNTRQLNDYKFMGDKWIDMDKKFHLDIQSKRGFKRDKNKNILITFYKVNQNYESRSKYKEDPSLVEEGKKLPPLILYGIHSPLGGPTTIVFKNSQMIKERAKIEELCETWQKNQYDEN